MDDLIERLKMALADKSFRKITQLAPMVGELHLPNIIRALKVMKKMGMVQFSGTDKVKLI